MKLPSYKKLNLNIKKILINENFQTYKDFKNKYKVLLLKKIKIWMISEKMNLKNLPKIFYILSYLSFKNYCYEKSIKKYLEKKQFTVWFSSSFEDYAYKIDLFAKSPKNTFYIIQIKKNKQSFTYLDKLVLLRAAVKYNAIPILIYKDLLNKKLFFEEIK